MSRCPLVSALFALGLVFLVSVSHTAHAQTAPESPKPMLTTLHTFIGADGETPECTLARGPEGAFYGTTILGGKGYGTVFKITADGRFTSLAQFDGTNGSQPGSLVFDAKSGRFYGVAEDGGTNDTGTLFWVATDGRITVLHSFGPKPDRSDHTNTGGANPFSPLILGKDGALYGTVRNGGRYGGGCLYKMTTEGAYTVLHDFDRGDGQHPEGAPYQSAEGMLYGTAFDGGRNGFGTVYKIGSKGKFKVLHSFSIEDSVYPDTSLIVLPDATLHGMTRGGRAAGVRVAFQITPQGEFTRLGASGSDGTPLPAFAPVAGPDGSFYGTRFHWSEEDGGCVYRVTPQGQTTVLYQFHAGAGGYGPEGDVVFGPDGALYGTTYNGGTDAQGAETGRGTIYRLTLPPTSSVH